jgi:regulator of cell morphogenesis and NO signaling
MSVPGINEFLTEDHDRLDGLLESFQEWKEQDLARAKEFWARFLWGLRRHLEWEEAILFPLFEQKTGRDGLIATLCGEHQEIREWLTALDSKVAEGDTDSSHEEKMLLEELGGHNAREEYALYPRLAQLLDEGQQRVVLDALAAVPFGG